MKQMRKFIILLLGFCLLFSCADYSNVDVFIETKDGVKIKAKNIDLFVDEALGAFHGRLDEICFEYKNISYRIYKPDLKKMTIEFKEK